MLKFYLLLSGLVFGLSGSTLYGMNEEPKNIGQPEVLANKTQTISLGFGYKNLRLKQAKMYDTEDLEQFSKTASQLARDIGLWMGVAPFVRVNEEEKKGTREEEIKKLTGFGLDTITQRFKELLDSIIDIEKRENNTFLPFVFSDIVRAAKKAGILKELERAAEGSIEDLPVVMQELFYFQKRTTTPIEKWEIDTNTFNVLKDEISIGQTAGNTLGRDDFERKYDSVKGRELVLKQIMAQKFFHVPTGQECRGEKGYEEIPCSNGAITGMLMKAIDEHNKGKGKDKPIKVMGAIDFDNTAFTTKIRFNEDEEGKIEEIQRGKEKPEYVIKTLETMQEEGNELFERDDLKSAALLKKLKKNPIEKDILTIVKNLEKILGKDNVYLHILTARDPVNPENFTGNFLEFAAQLKDTKLTQSQKALLEPMSDILDTHLRKDGNWETIATAYNKFVKEGLLPAIERDASTHEFLPTRNKGISFLSTPNNEGKYPKKGEELQILIEKYYKDANIIVVFDDNTFVVEDIQRLANANHFGDRTIVFVENRKSETL